LTVIERQKRNLVSYDIKGIRSCQIIKFKFNISMTPRKETQKALKEDETTSKQSNSQKTENGSRNKKKEAHEEEESTISRMEEEVTKKQSKQKIVKRKTKNNDPSPSRTASEEESSKVESKSHWTKFNSNLLKTPYLKRIIKKAKTDEEFYCTLCRESMVVNGLLRHIQTVKHKNNTPIQDHDKLASSIKKYKKNKGQEQDGDDDDDDDDENGEDSCTKDIQKKKAYLEFIAFLMSLKLSYSQIDKIGYYLKDLALRGRLNFLIKSNFSQERISKIATECFKPHLQANIIEDLKNNKYSVSIDASTVASENLCAIQVKYLKQNLLQETNTLKTSILYKTIGISTFKESSKAEVYLRMLNEKLFKNPGVRENLIGIAHDFAATLSDGKGGLVRMIKEEEGYPAFFDLRDPCHALSLAIKNSLGSLPDDITTFIVKIHSHFVSPQRKQQLIRIQEQMEIKIPLVLKRYVNTRWLSLGQSLERLIKLWEL